MNSKERREQRIRTAVKLDLAGRNQGEIAEDLGVTRWTVNKFLKEARGSGLYESVKESVQAPVSKDVAAGVDSAAGASPEEIQADAELEGLRAKARRGLDVGPQVTVVLSRKIQAKLVNELAAGTLKAKDAAAALNQVESSRKSAEAAIDIRAQVQKELAEELLSALDRVVPSEVYDKVVKELSRLARVGV